MLIRSIILTFYLVFLFLGLNQVYAATTTISYDPNPPPSSRVGDNFCSGAIQECWNSQAVGVTNCGIACTGGNAWTKYKYDSCYVNPDKPDEYIAWLPRASDTCSTADKCQYQPFLQSGRCDCSVGGTYKTCCTGDGNVNGSCVASGTQDNSFPDEGSCPGGSTTVMCGVSQSTCNAVYPMKCTTNSCGGDACSILAPAVPPPQPDPDPVPGPSCNCTYPEVCFTPNNTLGVRVCSGVNDSSTGVNVCKYDSSGTCNPGCTGCRSGGQPSPGGQTGSGRSGGGGGDMRIYVDPQTSLKGKNLTVTVTMRGYCKSNLRLYADTRDDNGNWINDFNRKLTGGFNSKNCKTKVAPHDNDASNNPKDKREGWGQWECLAENTGGCLRPSSDGSCIKENAKWTAGTETYDPNGDDGDECSEEMPYYINPSARIIGRFFMDINGDGLKQAAEPLIRTSENLCIDLDGNGVCDKNRPGIPDDPIESCTGFTKSDAYVEIGGKSNQSPVFCDAGGPYFDSGILPIGTYTVTYQAVGWGLTTPVPNSITENITGRREFLFGIRNPPCGNTEPGINQLKGCLWDGVLNSANTVDKTYQDGNAPSGKDLGTGFVPDSFTADVNTWPLNADWGTSIPNSFVGADVFYTIWKGRFNFRTDGIYTFYAGADDGVRLRFNEEPDVFTNTEWRNTGWVERPYTKKFVSTSPQEIWLEYYENGWAARASLRWTFKADANAWIQIDGDVHSNGRIKVP